MEKGEKEKKTLNEKTSTFPSQQRPSRHRNLRGGDVRVLRVRQEDERGSALAGLRRAPQRVRLPEPPHLLGREGSDRDHRVDGAGADGVDPDPVLRGQLGRERPHQRGHGRLGRGVVDDEGLGLRGLDRRSEDDRRPGLHSGQSQLHEAEGRDDVYREGTLEALGGDLGD